MSVIEEYEERLRLAMLRSDFQALDVLIADELIFVTHDGRIIGKADDLSAHKKKVFSLTRLGFERQEIRQHGEVAVAVAVANLAGVMAGEEFTDKIVYTRV